MTTKRKISMAETAITMRKTFVEPCWDTLCNEYVETDIISAHQLLEAMRFMREEGKHT